MTLPFGVLKMRWTLPLVVCAVVALKNTLRVTVAQVCGTKSADVVVLLDSSGSVGSKQFHKQLNFVKHLANKFTIGPYNVQIGLETFADSTTPHFFMNAYQSNKALEHAIDHVPYLSGGTHTWQALRDVMDYSFLKVAGKRDGVSNILIVVTDGMSNDRQATINAAYKLHKKNITTFVVGVGNNTNQSELESIASSRSHVYYVSRYDNLISLSVDMATAMCRVMLQFPLTTQTSRSIVSLSTRQQTTNYLTSTVTPHATNVVTSLSTKQDSNVLCDTCKDVFTAQCLGNFTLCPGVCMVLEKENKLQTKCVEALECMYHHNLDILSHSTTICCRTNDCFQSTIVARNLAYIQRNLNTTKPMFTKTTPIEMSNSQPAHSQTTATSTQTTVQKKLVTLHLFGKK